VAFTIPEVTEDPCRSWLASEEASQFSIPLTDPPPSPASRLLQCFVAFTNPEVTEDPCRSWLASEEAGTSNIFIA